MNHAVVWAGLRRFAGEEARKWRVLATATMGMAAAFGGIGTISVLMEPFQSEFGWARAEISAAYVVMTAGIATGGLMAGRLADRLPAGPLSAAGAAILGLGVALLSLQSSIEAMQAVYLLMGFFGFSLLQAPLLATVSLWFRKGLALGVVTAGGTLGQAALPPVFQAMVLEFGWRDACAWLGLGYIVLIAPVLLFITRPAGSGPGSPPSSPSAWSLPPVPAVALLAAAGLACCALMGTPTIHLIAHMRSLGYAPETAASLATVTMTAGVAGRIGTGLIVDRIGSLRAYALVSLLQTVAMVAFARTEGLWPLYLTGIVYGLGFGGAMTGLVCCVRDAVPARHVATAMAIVGMFAWAGMATGGYQGGLCFDITGSYAMSFKLSAMFGMFNLFCLGIVWRMLRRHAGTSPAAP